MSFLAIVFLSIQPTWWFSSFIQCEEEHLLYLHNYCGKSRPSKRKKGFRWRASGRNDWCTLPSWWYTHTHQPRPKRIVPGLLQDKNPSPCLMFPRWPFTFCLHLFFPAKNFLLFFHFIFINQTIRCVCVCVWPSFLLWSLLHNGDIPVSGIIFHYGPAVQSGAFRIFLPLDWTIKFQQHQTRIHQRVDDIRFLTCLGVLYLNIWGFRLFRAGLVFFKNKRNRLELDEKK